jgi:hypothetical protein
MIKKEKAASASLAWKEREGPTNKCGFVNYMGPSFSSLLTQD